MDLARLQSAVRCDIFLARKAICAEGRRRLCWSRARVRGTEGCRRGFIDDAWRDGGRRWWPCAPRHGLEKRKARDAGLVYRRLSLLESRLSLLRGRARLGRRLLVVDCRILLDESVCRSLLRVHQDFISQNVCTSGPQAALMHNGATPSALPVWRAQASCPPAQARCGLSYASCQTPGACRSAATGCRSKSAAFPGRQAGTAL